MRLLVTGASGFIGRRFLETAPADWSIAALWNRREDFPGFVEGLGRPGLLAHRADLSDTNGTRALGRSIGADFDAILHLAANGDPTRSLSDPASDLVETQAVALNVFTTFRAAHLVTFSSGAVYEGARGPVDPRTPCDPVLPYSITHLAAERYARWAEAEGRFAAATVVRFFGAYGPHEPERKIYTKICRAFALERHRAFTLRGDGTNLIDAMYVDDATAAIRVLLDRGPAGASGTWDLASGAPVTLRELVEIAARVFDVAPVEIRYEGDAAERHWFRASAGAFAKSFGFRPAIPLEEGLKRHASWLVNRS